MRSTGPLKCCAFQFPSRFALRRPVTSDVMFRRTETEDVDYRSFYHLESYLERTVKARFERDGELSAFGFFCIVIWKANRAKTKVATRLLRATSNDLDGAARELTRAIAAAPTKRRKMEVLVKEWKFRLPMASAILSVLYPKDFTVYDVRVCNVLGGFRSLRTRHRWIRFGLSTSRSLKRLDELHLLA